VAEKQTKIRNYKYQIKYNRQPKIHGRLQLLLNWLVRPPDESSEGFLRRKTLKTPKTNIDETQKVFTSIENGTTI